MSDYLVGIGLFVALGIGWTLVQAGWRRAFADSVPGSDALAGRSECGQGGCGACDAGCERSTTEARRARPRQRAIPEERS